MAEKGLLRRCVDAVFFTEILKGLGLTLRRLFSRPVTRQYPFERRDPFPGSRGLHALVKDEKTGQAKCVGCGLCAALCPSRCIRVYTAEGDGHAKVVERYEIDTLRCIFCAYCVEACPFGAVVLTPHFEYSGFSRAPFTYDKDRLLENWDRHMAGGRGREYLERFWGPRLSDFGAKP